MRRSVVFYGFLFFILMARCLPGPVFAQSQSPELQAFAQIQGNPALEKQLAQIVAVAQANAFGETLPLPAPLDPVFQKPLALFVTAKDVQGVRGCMGNRFPQHKNMAQEIQENLRRAFFQDPRHTSIDPAELPGLKIYLTAVGKPQAVTANQINPARDAILLRHGAKEAVVLPGEAKTVRYLMAFAKAKAGIGPGDPYQIYRLPSVTLEVPKQPSAP